MILVTGAAGKSGQAVIAELAKQGEHVRALVHRSEQSQIVLDLGAEEVFVGDMTQKESLQAAGRGIHAIYHICPNVSPDEFSIGQNVIGIARTNGIEDFVYHSVLQPQIGAMPHHWEKLRVEELLINSGLDFTILQPAAYMQNVLGAWARIAGEGIYSVPYPLETKLGMVDLRDIAEVAVNVVADQGHRRATYELAGNQVLSQVEIANSLSQILNRPVKAIEESIVSWRNRMKILGMGSYQIETLTKMFDYYAKQGFWGNSRSLEYLLGRAPNTLEVVLNRHLKALH